MSIVGTAKDHPIKSLLGVTTSIIAIVAALFTVDARYAHASDVEKNREETRQTIQDSSLILRKQAIEDKLFEYDLKTEQSPNGRLSPFDTAMQKRYKRQLDDIRAKKLLE
jgi:hypothetical protein